MLGKLATFGALAALWALPAYAATIVVDFSFDGVATLNNSGAVGVSTSSFAEFAAGLGTLTGVTVNLAGAGALTPIGNVQADFITPGSNPNVSIGALQGGVLNGTTFQVSADDEVSGPTLANFFIGGGTQSLLLDYDILSPPGHLVSAVGTGTVTYEYVPDTAVPEPASALMLLPAVFGLGMLYLRRKESHAA